NMLKIVELYNQNGEKILLTQKAYVKFYHIDQLPDPRTIRQIVKKLREESGRPKTVRTEQNIQRVNVKENIETSLAIQSQEHTLQPRGYNKRIEFVNAIENLLRNDENVLDKIIMSDEAYFFLNGEVNKQNTRYWSKENPHVTIDKFLHSKKVTCGLTSEKITRPYFSEMKRKYSHSKCRQLQKNDFRIFGRRSSRQKRFVTERLFQTVSGTIAFFKTNFEDRSISIGGKIEWLARSLNLSSSNFFLYLENRVYKNKPKTLDDLKDNIDKKIQKIGRDTLKKVIQSFYERIFKCRELGGRHLNNILFYT
uniref:DUF4817 domain-containing protein n=1 Tax=Strongyloides stercoralis TaxID=6248 RepID=A0AAF5DN60_STRER